MDALSDYLENKLIDHLLRATPYTAPATVYVGLLTAPTADGGGGTEVTGGGYARVPITSGLAAWAGTQAAASTTASSGTSGTTSNNGAVNFPTPSASWGAVSDFAVFDAATGGNLLFYGSLSTVKTINSGDTVSFPASALSFQIDT